MMRLLRRFGRGPSAIPDAMVGAGGQVTPRRGWHRYLTLDNAFFAVMLLLVLAFALARWQGFFLASPSVETKPQDKRSVIAPDFALPSLAGSTVRLSDHHGRVILLNFWATWCPPCRAEMPSMGKLYQAYRDRGLVILAVSTDRTGRSVVESFVRERGVTFPILLDPEGESFAEYGGRGLPTSFLVDRRGRIVSTEVGAQNWDSTAARMVVETLLNEE
jgi:peroxiredoxin